MNENAGTDYLNYIHESNLDVELLSFISDGNIPCDWRIRRLTTEKLNLSCNMIYQR